MVLNWILCHFWDFLHCRDGSFWWRNYSSGGDVFCWRKTWWKGIIGFSQGHRALCPIWCRFDLDARCHKRTLMSVTSLLKFWCAHSCLFSQAVFLLEQLMGCSSTFHSWWQFLIYGNPLVHDRHPLSNELHEWEFCNAFKLMEICCFFQKAVWTSLRG